MMTIWLKNGRTTVKWRSPIKTKFPANSYRAQIFFRQNMVGARDWFSFCMR